MKLENFELNQQETEIVSQNEQFKRYHLVDSLFLHPGHNAFFLDLKTGDIGVVKRDLDIALNIKTKQVHKHSKTGFNFDYMYTSALNEKNAEKHFRKMLDNVREKATFLRKNVLLDITKHECWPFLKSLGFTEFSGELVVAAGITEVVGIQVFAQTKDYTDGSTMSICSIYPKVLKDENIYYFFEMIGGHAKIPVDMLNEEMIKGYSVLAYDRFFNMVGKSDAFTSAYRLAFNERYQQFKLANDVNYNPTSDKPKRAKRSKSDANRQV